MAELSVNSVTKCTSEKLHGTIASRNSHTGATKKLSNTFECDAEELGSNPVSNSFFPCKKVSTS